MIECKHFDIQQLSEGDSEIHHAGSWRCNDCLMPFYPETTLTASQARVRELELELVVNNKILDLTWAVVEYVVGHTPYEEELEDLAKKAFFHDF